MKPGYQNSQRVDSGDHGWRSLLRQHDPADGSVDPQRAIEIRHAAIELARHSEPGVSAWPWRLAAGVLAIVLLAAAAGDDGQRPIEERPVVASPGGERRQVQFATPGGTRIIWEINPEFAVREMVP